MRGTHLEERVADVRPRTAANLLLWAILGFVAVALLWAWLTVLDRSVAAHGRIAPSSQLQIVSNLEGGVVGAILVQPGEMVARGTPLVRLDPTILTADLAGGRAAVGALSAKLARLDAEMEGRAPSFAGASAEQAADERALYAARQADLAAMDGVGRARIAQAERAVVEARAALEAQTVLRASKQAELTLLRPLVAGGIEPRLSLMQAESAAAMAAQSVAAAAAALARAQAAVAEARQALTQQRQDWRTRSGDALTQTRAELDARRQAMPALANRAERTVVRAPRAGRVNRVLVSTIGGTVRPGDPLVELVPSNDALIVEAAVNPKDIAFVRVGQPAKVKITAYDSAIYGALDGHVLTISPDAATDQRTGDSHYIVRIRTDRDALRDGRGARLPIGPGMIADVSLIGDKRSVLSYLLTPFTRLRDGAFRE